MNREKWFAAIVVPLAILLAVWSYLDVYAEKASPQGKPLAAEAPDVEDWPDRSDAERDAKGLEDLAVLQQVQLAFAFLDDDEVSQREIAGLDQAGSEQ